MPSYTPIATLPYPAMSDPPNGPDQLLQLARAIEPKLVNRFTSAATRNAKITAPSLGMLSFRDDDKVYEFWNGSSWVGIDQSVAISGRGAVSSVTDKAYTTTESSHMCLSTVTLTNPSKLYRMMYFLHSEFNEAHTWTAAGLYATVRHYVRIGGVVGTESGRTWSQYSHVPGNAVNFSGAWPARAGYIAAGASLKFETWFTIEKSNATAGTLTYISGSTDITIIGVTSL